MSTASSAAPSSPSLLLRLASVAIQLVAQFLGVADKLALARCSRRMLHECAQPLAWRDGLPLVVSAAAAAAAGCDPAVRLRRSALLRHCPVHFLWDAPTTVATVTALPNLHTLEVWHSARLFVTEWPSLLSHPALRQLHSLRFPYPASAPLPDAVLQLAAHSLPQLRTLTLAGAESDAALAPLLALPSLTELTFDCGPLQVDHSAALSVIAQCARLQILTLRSPLFGPGDLRSFLCALGRTAQLRHLALEYFCAAVEFEGQPPPTDADWRAGLSALGGLQSLRLRRIFGLDALLPLLSSAPVLRSLQLDLEADYSRDAAAFGSCLPSAAAVRGLLEAVPLLQVQLHMAASADEWAGAENDEDEGEADERARQWSSLQAEFASPQWQRVQIVTTDEQ